MFSTRPFATHRQKQWPVLSANTIAFAGNFAVWTLFSILGIQIKQNLGLTDTQFGIPNQYLDKQINCFFNN